MEKKKTYSLVHPDPWCPIKTVNKSIFLVTTQGNKATKIKSNPEYWQTNGVGYITLTQWDRSNMQLMTSLSKESQVTTVHNPRWPVSEVNRQVSLQTFSLDWISSSSGSKSRGSVIAKSDPIQYSTIPTWIQCFRSIYYFGMLLNPILFSSLNVHIRPCDCSVI